MKRFWLSWEETSDDYRPVDDPPERAVLAWWCSGEAGDGSYSTMVALVEEASEELAKAAVLKSWPGSPTWRFCGERRFDWRPGDRFPITKAWERERVEGRR